MPKLIVMIFKNTFFLSIGQAVGKLLVFILYVYLARSLSVKDFGVFNFIFAYCAIFGIFMDFGMDLLLPKLVAQSPLKLQFLISFLKFKLLCIILVLICYLFLTIQLPNITFSITYVLAGLGTALYSMLSFSYGIYRGKEELKYEAIFTIIHKALFVSIAIAFVSFGFSLSGVFGALLIASIIVLSFATIDIYKKYAKLIIYKVEGELNNTKKIFQEALPFFFINVFTIIYFRVDTLMLSFLKSNYDVGIYNAAYRIMEGLIFIPGAFMTAYFPELVRAANTDNKTLNERFKKGLLLLSVIGFLLSAILYSGAKIFITLFWGQKYIDSTIILKLLAVALFIIHFNYIVTQTVIAQNKEKIYMIAVVCAVILNVCLNFPLINLFGSKGAALSTIATELFLGSFLFIQIAIMNKKN